MRSGGSRHPLRLLELAQLADPLVVDELAHGGVAVLVEDRRRAHHLLQPRGRRAPRAASVRTLPEDDCRERTAGGRALLPADDCRDGVGAGSAAALSERARVCRSERTWTAPRPTIALSRLLAAGSWPLTRRCSRSARMSGCTGRSGRGLRGSRPWRSRSASLSAAEKPPRARAETSCCEERRRSSSRSSELLSSCSGGGGPGGGGGRDDGGGGGARGAALRPGAAPAAGAVLARLCKAFSDRFPTPARTLRGVTAEV